MCVVYLLPARRAGAVLALLVLGTLLLAGCGSGMTLMDQQVAHAAPAVPRPLVASDGSLLVVGSPTVSAAFIDRVLTFYGSPAVGLGQSLYDLGVQYHIDPVFALAFFQHESSFGLKGEATTSHSIGNLRCILGYVCQDNFAQFPTWQASVEPWYQLISGPAYVASGLTSIRQIVLKYAPPQDHNNDVAYVASIDHAVQTWRAGVVEVA